MHPTDKAARIAGALYLGLMPFAPFALIYVPNKLIVRGNAAATSANFIANESLFRMSIAADLIASVIFIFVALALYRLFSGVDKTLSVTMSVLALISAGIGMANVANHIAAMSLFRGADFLAAFDQPQRDALGMMFLKVYGYGISVNEIFWGLWLFPFGILVMRSRFLPRILGVLLIINGFAYIAESLMAILAPGSARMINPYTTIAETGELWIMLWLLFKGANVETLPAESITAPAF